LQQQTAKIKQVVGIVVENKGRTELVVHRAIGQTSLSHDDWVITPVGEITQLLARKVDPDRAITITARAKLASEIMVSEHALTLDPESGELHYNDDSEESRHSLLKRKKGLGPLTDEFIEIDRMEEELKEWKETFGLTEKLESEIPDNFETKSGVLRDQKQKAVPYLHGKTQEQVVDAIADRIYGIDL